MTAKSPQLLTELEQQLAGAQGLQHAQNIQAQLQQIEQRLQQTMAKGLSPADYELHQAGVQACSAASELMQRYLQQP